MSKRVFDVVIIGAGIAGASLASLLSRGLSVCLVEQEPQPGYHSTGRSAAIFSQIYGSASIRALTRASRSFLHEPPAGFSDHALLRRCGVMFIAREDQRARIDSFATLEDVAPATRRLSGEQACALLPVLRRGYAAEAVIEDAAAEIDVHALHHGYLRQVRRNGGQLFTDAEAIGITRVNGGWEVETRQGIFAANILVNASGAWADHIAGLAGVRPIGISPRRRTAIIVDAGNAEVSAWPMTVDIDEQFYLKPDAGRLLISPADETPVMPCDVQPEDYDVAVAVDRIERATTLEIGRIRNKWAGLRNFAPDRSPVIGYDPEASGFFWMAGQGGYGIQTAMGAAILGTALLAGEAVPGTLTDLGLVPAEIAPGRFAAAADIAAPT